VGSALHFRSACGSSRYPRMPSFRTGCRLVCPAGLRANVSRPANRQVKDIAREREEERAGAQNSHRGLSILRKRLKELSSTGEQAVAGVRSPRLLCSSIGNVSTERHPDRNRNRGCGVVSCGENGDGSGSFSERESLPHKLHRNRLRGSIFESCLRLSRPAVVERAQGRGQGL
jgi:hypothetical protein